MGKFDFKPQDNTIVRAKLSADVYKRASNPDEWAVEAVDDTDDGTVYVALFSGPFAKDRALEYSAAAFDEVNCARGA